MLHPALPPLGVLTGAERKCQQNGSLADGYRYRSATPRVQGSAAGPAARVRRWARSATRMLTRSSSTVAAHATPWARGGGSGGVR